jgi:hypothetical protein
MDHYFGGGERAKPPSKGGTPVQSILLQPVARTPERATATDNTVESQLTPERVDNAGKGEVTNAGNIAVDLEGFTMVVRPKGSGSKKRDEKGSQGRTTEERVK